MSDGFIEVEGGGYYRLTPAGETELARLLISDRAKKTSATQQLRADLRHCCGAGLKALPRTGGSK